jgi:hypothetical protein
MSESGLGCAKTPAVAPHVEISPGNCIPESQIILHTRGSMPCWRIVFSTFCGCMSFYTGSVKSRKARSEHIRSGLPSRSDIAAAFRHFRKVPCVDGSGLARRIVTSQAWSVQPCVRPVCAVHMTAGHNALRGSGPGQKPAFENAVAHVGCPDRRIDRLCITCCSPSQPCMGQILSSLIFDLFSFDVGGDHLLMT